MCAIFTTIQFDIIRNEFAGRYIVYCNNFSYVDYEKYKFLSNVFKDLTNSVNIFKKNFIGKTSNIIYCNGFEFIGYKDIVYKQLIAICRWDNTEVNIPVYNFKASAGAYWGPNFNIKMFFKEKKSFIIEDVEKWTKNQQIFDYVGLDVRFNPNYRRTKDFGNHSFIGWNVQTESNYILSPNTVYHCDGLDICQYDDKHMSNSALSFHDNRGIKFQIGLHAFITNLNDDNYPVFIKEDEYQAELHRKRKEAEVQRQYEEARQRAEEVRRVERRERLIQLYGILDAETIIHGKVIIGFSKDMCIEAWGRPNKVNRTETRWNKHEQWVYSRGRYLYFEGNKLTGIQD